MNQILTELVPQLIPLLGAIFIALASWAVAVLRNKIKMEAGKAALDEVDRAVKAVVGDLSQTMANDWKAAAADGHLSAEEKASLKSMAMEKTRKLISTEVTKASSKIVDDLGDYISKKIEEQVLAAKAKE